MNQPKFTVPQPFVGLCADLFNSNCCNHLLKELKIPSPVCLTLFATKLIGYFIVIGASAVKLPQVIKLFRSKSGAGITLFGVTLELLAITFNACYSYKNNFPFSAWGEAVFLAIETCMIGFFVLWYDNKKFHALTYMSMYILIVSFIVHPNFIPRNLVWYMQSTVLPFSVAGKLIQAKKNFQVKNTGQLSAVTAVSIFIGSVIRVLTTLQETGDKLTAITFACSSLANFVIAFQVFYYWASTNKFLERGMKKKEQ